MTIDDPRNDLKVEYIDALSAHTANVRRDTGVDPFLFGDFNVARRTVDCSLHIDEGKWPSTYPKERAAFERLLKSQNLSDAYADFHPALNDPKAYQGSLDKHISWWSTRCDPPVGMRLDYLLAPRAHLSNPTTLPSLRSIEFAHHSFGNDHRSLIASFEHAHMKFRAWCSSFGPGTFVSNGTAVTCYGKYPLI
jgi:exonuclease III